jgi:3-oxoacyl-[acyl-carrier-protein] synthase-3
MRSLIVGTGSYVPEKILTNADLERMVDTNDQWIVERTGIKERNVAAENEASSDLALKAAHKALKMAGVRAEDVDLIVVGTITPDMPFPSAAAMLQAHLHNKKAFAFDVSAACAGSLYALAVADRFVCTGVSRAALVVGVEVLTRVTNWKDRNTCILFGDAAGAMVLVPTQDQNRGLLSTHLHTDGSYWSILNMPGGGSRLPCSQKVVDGNLATIQMNGREVYKVAVRALEEVSREALAANGMQPKDVDHVIAHQANKRILDSTLQRLAIPPEKCWMNLEKYGNTSSASVPMTLDEANRAGWFAPGDLILMMAIGGGMSWGSALHRW